MHVKYTETREIGYSYTSKVNICAKWKTMNARNQRNQKQPAARTDIKQRDPLGALVGRRRNVNVRRRENDKGRLADAGEAARDRQRVELSANPRGLR